MVTSGTQQALDLVLRLALPPGGSGAGRVAHLPERAGGARRPPGPDHHPRPGRRRPGWDAELLLGSLRQTRPRLAYLIPEFQNPTGHLMPVSLRERVVAAAHAGGTDLVVDESFVDLPLDGNPVPPPVAVFDRHSRVISIGGMSKPYWGGLRIGWVRASAAAGAAAGRRPGRRRHGQPGARPARRRTPAGRRRADRRRPAGAAAPAQRDALVAALAAALPDWRVTVPGGGVTLWAELDGPVSSALARAAEEVGVRLAPGPRFGLDGTLERFLRLPFTLPAADLVDAVRRIATVRYDLDRTRRPQWREPAMIA